MRKWPKSGLSYRSEQFTTLNMTYPNAATVSTDIRQLCFAPNQGFHIKCTITNCTFRNMYQNMKFHILNTIHWMAQKFSLRRWYIRHVSTSGRVELRKITWCHNLLLNFMNSLIQKFQTQARAWRILEVTEICVYIDVSNMAICDIVIFNLKQVHENFS